MTFKDEETAKLYLNIVETFDENYEITLDENKILMEVQEMEKIANDLIERFEYATKTHIKEYIE